MFTILAVSFCALLSSFVLTPFCRDFFGFLQFVDQPDEERKIHSRPVPRIGGISLACSYLVAIAALAVAVWKGLLGWQDPSLQTMLRLLPAVAMIFGAGLYDDIRGLSPWRKLGWEVIASVYAVLVGVPLALPLGASLSTIVAAGLASVVWLILCTNALNLIDGLDGLATGVALIASASLLVTAVIHHRPDMVLMMAPMVGCLCGFLYYNFNPASVFLGDCGSLPAGFLLGCYGLVWYQGGASNPGSSSLGMTVPFIALSLPLAEVMLSIARRYLRNRPIFSADGNHIHHRILSRGLSHRNAALVLYGVCAATATLAVLQTIVHPRIATLLLGVSMALAYIGFRRLRYTEFSVLHISFFSGDFRRFLRTRIHLRDFQDALFLAHTEEQCWVALRNACRESLFCYVALQIGGSYFEEEIQNAPAATLWCMHIPLEGSDFVVFHHDSQAAELAILIAPLVDGLRAKLTAPERLPEKLVVTMQKVNRPIAV